MALKNLYTDDRRDESIPDAYYRINDVFLRGDICTFNLCVWKSRSKYQNGGKPLEYGMELLTGPPLGLPVRFLVERGTSTSIYKQIYDYIKTLPGWENAIDAND